MLPEVGRLGGRRWGALGWLWGHKASEAGPPIPVPMFTRPRACIPHFPGGKQAISLQGSDWSVSWALPHFLTSPHCQ